MYQLQNNEQRVTKRKKPIEDQKFRYSMVPVLRLT